MMEFVQERRSALDPSIRKLREPDRLSILQHFMRLDAASRRSRFGGGVSEEFMRKYTEQLMRIGTVLFGAFPDNELRGMAELTRRIDAVQATAEAAFSVEMEWQGRGIGNALMNRIVAAAQGRGFTKLHMICLRDNAKMRHIAAKQNAVLYVDSLQIEATLEPAFSPAGPLPAKRFHATT